MVVPESQTSVNRRMLLRGGAIAAGAAGVTAVGAALAPTASAADGDAVKLGQAQSATKTTELQIGSAAAGDAKPTLALKNAGGPALYLEPVPNWDGEVGIGEIVSTDRGPEVGVASYAPEPVTTFLATGIDLLEMTRPVAIRPLRIADTRNADGRGGIVRTSTGAFDSAFRLKRGAWMDVAVGRANESYTIEAAFVNVTVTGGLTGGYLTLYEGGNVPGSSSLTFAKGQAIANGGFTRVGVFNDTTFTLRIYTSATTHVIVDMTGLTLNNIPGPGSVQGGRRLRSAARRSRVAMRPPSSLGRR